MMDSAPPLASLTRAPLAGPCGATVGGWGARSRQPQPQAAKERKKERKKSSERYELSFIAECGTCASSPSPASVILKDAGDAIY